MSAGWAVAWRGLKAITYIFASMAMVGLSTKMKE
jgi:hypothetical protein